MRAVVNGIFYLLRTGCQWRFTLGLPIASWVAPAKLSGKRGAKRLIAGLGSLWVTIRTVIADGGHKSKRLAAEVKRREGWKLVIVKRCEGAFKITGLTWAIREDLCPVGPLSTSLQRL